MKENRVLFLSINMDKHQKIFQKKSLWYFIPALCCKVTADNVLPPILDDKDWINMEFKLLSDPHTDPLPWLIGLLYEFCFPVNVITSPTLCKSNVKEVEVHIEVNRAESNCNIKVLWPLGVEKDRQHAAIKAECIKEVLETSPVLQHMARPIRVTGRHTSNFNLQEASKKAVDLWNKQMENDSTRRSKSIMRGKKQELL